MNDELNIDANTMNDEGTNGQIVNATDQTSSDPLDAITDPDVLRNKAKGYRAEKTRLKVDLTETKGALASGNPMQKPVTYGDVLKQNERKGFDLLKDNDDIVSNKDKILPFVNTNYGSQVPEPEEVAERWKDAHAAFRRRNPKTLEINQGTALQTDSGVVGRSQTADGAATKVTVKSNWDSTPGPDAWYPAKKAQG